MLRAFRAAAVAGAMLCAPAFAAIPDDDCLACHEAKDVRPQGAHQRLACASCHAGIRELPHAESLPRVECSACHADAAAAYAKSVHATARGNGMPDAATCRSCHGHGHRVALGSDPGSPVAKRHLADTCGACHANPEFLARHRIPFARPVEAYRLSVHGRAVASGEEAAPSCSDCHGSHDVVAGRSPGSPIARESVASTCGACHSEIQETWAGSIHGQATARGAEAAPVCTDCHGEHAILGKGESDSPVHRTRVAAVTCGRCHADERLAARYNLPLDRVRTFADSFHGLALRGGEQTVANCASCHGVHDILPSSDPRSSVHPQNLPRTCGACHPGAGQRFAIGAVHVDVEAATVHPVVRAIRLAYVVLIPLVIGGMLLHNAADFLVKLVRGARAGHGAQQVERMNLHFRIAHGLVVLSFPALVWSGFALKYPEAWWAALPWRGELHRVAACVLLAAVAYHLGHLALVRSDRSFLRHMLPRLRDLLDLRAFLAWLRGRSARPRFRVFSYAEKAEYWAFVWGTLIMAATGFLLWFENWTLRHFPKWVIDAATALHWYEAVLATLAILVWHLYLVIFDPEVYPMEKAWLTGRVPADHLRATRPAYHRAVLAASRKRKPEGESA
jgi:cytochrome b subunit of formate dehydrogenase